MKSNKNYKTILSVLSAVAVVFLHVNCNFWNFSKSNIWIISNFVECLFYFAVPIFFMISGANLINYQEKYSTKDFFVKRIKKTVIPFIAWSFIGLAYQIFITKSVTPASLTIKMILDGIVNTKFVGIYWFFPVLFCLYLCVPLFASVEKSKRESIFKYLVICGLICNSFIPLLIKVLNVDFYFPINLPVVTGYVIFLLLGYLIDNYDIKKGTRICIYILAIVGFLIHFLGTLYLSFNNGYIVETFKGYTNVPCIMYSVGIFVFVKYNYSKVEKYNLLSRLNPYTFPLYLIHWYLIQIPIMYFNINIASIWFILFFPIPVIITSVLITKVLRLIPGIKKIVP